MYQDNVRLVKALMRLQERYQEGTIKSLYSRSKALLLLYRPTMRW